MIFFSNDVCYRRGDLDSTLRQCPQLECSLPYAVSRWCVRRRCPGKLRFHRVKASTQEELLHLAHTLSHRVARFLERWGLLERDAENSYLVFEQQEEDATQQFFGHSITYRIAIGPHQSRKVFTLQTLPPLAESGDSRQAAKVAGFSLHAGVIAEPHRRDKLEMKRCSKSVGSFYWKAILVRWIWVVCYYPFMANPLIASIGPIITP